MASYILHIYECCNRKCNAALQADTFVYLSLYIYIGIGELSIYIRIGKLSAKPWTADSAVSENHYTINFIYIYAIDIHIYVYIY